MSSQDRRVVSVIGWALIAPFALVSFVILSGLLYFAYCELSKAYWDSRVAELCEKDGGVTVFERVELTQEEYIRNGGKNGFIAAPSEKSPISYKRDYFSKSETIFINKNPIVRRSESTIYRRLDMKELGKIVIYGRSGGDFPLLPGVGTSFSCFKLSHIKMDIERQIFSFNGDEK